MVDSSTRSQTILLTPNYLNGNATTVPALLRRLLRAKDAMDRASDEEWPVRSLAKVSGVSAAHFARSFKDAFSVPPHRYLLTRRIECAKAMLRDTELAITDIAFQTGWQSLGTFGRIFRDITRASPGEVRASSRDADAKPDRAFMPECFLRAAHRPDLKTAVSEKRRREAGGKKGPTKSRRPHEPRRRSSRSVRARPG